MDFAYLFNQSFEENVHLHYDEFIDLFYDNFINSASAVKKLFSSGDIQRQKDMMESSLLMLVDFTVHRSASGGLHTLADVHAKRGVDGAMYDLWVESLLKTLRQMDKHFNDEKALAWRVTLAPGIEFMKHYRRTLG